MRYLFFVLFVPFSFFLSLECENSGKVKEVFAILKKEKSCISDIDFSIDDIKECASGRNGCTYVVKNKYIVKEFYQKDEEYSGDNIAKEISVYEAFIHNYGTNGDESCRNIVRCLGIIYNKSKEGQVSTPTQLKGESVLPSSNNHNVFVILDFCDGGTIKTKIVEGRYGLVHIHKTLKCFYDIMNGVISLHRLGFVHRDLKTDNIMLCSKSSAISENISSDYTVKIIDLGSSLKVGDSGDFCEEVDIAGAIKNYSNDLLRDTLESIDNNKADNNTNKLYKVNKGVLFANDFFALGCVLYEMLFLKEMFEEYGATNVFNYLWGGWHNKETYVKNTFGGRKNFDITKDENYIKLCRLSEKKEDKNSNLYILAKDIIFNFIGENTKMSVKENRLKTIELLKQRFMYEVFSQ